MNIIFKKIIGITSALVLLLAPAYPVIVNADEIASNNILSQIGKEADDPDEVKSVVTAEELSEILPAISGIMKFNESVYQKYIDENPDEFSSPAMRIEIRIMVNKVNTEDSEGISNSVLSQIGKEADDPDEVKSIITTEQLDQIIPELKYVRSWNEEGYQTYIDARPEEFSNPATATEIELMVDTVNEEGEKLDNGYNDGDDEEDSMSAEDIGIKLISAMAEGIAVCYAATAAGEYMGDLKDKGMDMVKDKVSGSVSSLLGGGGLGKDNPVPVKDKETHKGLEEDTLENKTANTKECGLDYAAKSLGTQLLRGIIQSTTEWVRGGMEGKPKFLTDPDQFLDDAIDKFVGDFIGGNADTSFLCSSFQIPIKFAINLNFNGGEKTQASIPSCTMKDIEQNVKGALGDLTNFTSGGKLDAKGFWDSFLNVNSSSSNNPYGAYIDLSNDMQQLISEENRKKMEDVNRNGGFMSIERCESGNSSTYSWDAENRYGCSGGSCGSSVTSSSTSSSSCGPGGCPSSAGSSTTSADSSTSKWAGAWKQSGTRNVCGPNGCSSAVSGGGTSSSITSSGGYSPSSSSSAGSNCEYVTPGKLIADEVSDVMQIPREQLQLADDFDELIMAIIGLLKEKLTEKLFNSETGLSHLSEDDEKFIEDTEFDTSGILQGVIEMKINAMAGSLLSRLSLQNIILTEKRDMLSRIEKYINFLEVEWNDAQVNGDKYFFYNEDYISNQRDDDSETALEMELGDFNGLTKIEENLNYYLTEVINVNDRRGVKSLNQRTKDDVLDVLQKFKEKIIDIDKANSELELELNLKNIEILKTAEENNEEINSEGVESLIDDINSMDLDRELENYRDLINKYDAYINGEQVKHTNQNKGYWTNGLIIAEQYIYSADNKTVDKNFIDVVSASEEWDEIYEYPITMRRNIFWDLSTLQGDINTILNSEEYTQDDIYKILDQDWEREDNEDGKDEDSEDEQEIDMDYEEVTSTIINPERSEYEEEISLPEYNSSNINMLLIKSDSDWDEINNPDIRYFFVRPGNYTGAGIVSLTASGTSDKKRYIILEDGDDIHPAQKIFRAEVSLNFDGGDYWVVDRMATTRRSEGDIMIFSNNSSHNIINRFYTRKYYSGIKILSGSNYNTIQNSRLENQTLEGRKADGVGIWLMSDPITGPANISGTKIIDNEILNNNDGIMISSQLASETNAPGTIIDGNQISINSSVYTDCNGRRRSNGSCAYAENAIDIKGGTDNAARPILVTNNYMWGFRRSDKTDGSILSSHGAALVVHYATKNMKIKNNIIFNSNRAFEFSDLSGRGYSLGYSKISDNILYNIYDYAIDAFSTKDVEINNNVMKDCDKEKALNDNDNLTYRNNGPAEIDDIIFTAHRYTDYPTNITISAGTVSDTDSGTE